MNDDKPIHNGITPYKVPLGCGYKSKTMKCCYVFTVVNHQNECNILQM